MDYRTRTIGHSICGKISIQDHAFHFVCVQCKIEVRKSTLNAIEAGLEDKVVHKD